MNWFYLIIGPIIGDLLSFFLGYYLAKKKGLERACIGNLRKDRSDPEDSPYLFLELEQGGLDALQKAEYVTLHVRRENYLPRE